jgi:uroporphyrinogen decarboxylase
MSTDLEVYYATAEHRAPDRILYYAPLTEDLERRVTEHIGGGDYWEHYGMFKPVDLWPRRPEGVEPPDYSRYWEDADLPEGATINSDGVAMVPSGLYHFWGYVSPLRNAKSLSELEAYPIEDVSGWDMSFMADVVAEAHARGKVVRGRGFSEVYEVAWQIRGYEQFLMDMVERPAWAECLMERLMHQATLKATAYARAGVDWIDCGDDIGTQKGMMYSLRTWRRIIHSRWSKLWAAVKEISPSSKIFYHSDGNIITAVPELVEAGIDILNPLQPECLDVDAIHREFGDRLTFDGTIGTQSTMPFGTPDDVRERVKEVIEKYGQNGGLIVSPTHVLEPDVPIANLEAFCEACRT